MAEARSASVVRKTNETDIKVTLTLDNLDDAQSINIRTGIGFLDHVSIVINLNSAVN
jgi:imidazoleglycerol-phosphate dehydratase